MWDWHWMRWENGQWWWDQGSQWSPGWNTEILLNSQDGKSPFPFCIRRKNGAMCICGAAYSTELSEVPCQGTKRKSSWPISSLRESQPGGLLQTHLLISQRFDIYKSVFSLSAPNSSSSSSNFSTSDLLLSGNIEINVYLIFIVYLFFFQCSLSFMSMSMCLYEYWPLYKRSQK